MLASRLGRLGTGKGKLGTGKGKLGTGKGRQSMGMLCRPSCARPVGGGRKKKQAHKGGDQHTNAVYLLCSHYRIDTASLGRAESKICPLDIFVGRRIPLSYHSLPNHSLSNHSLSNHRATVAPVFGNLAQNLLLRLFWQILASAGTRGTAARLCSG